MKCFKNLSAIAVILTVFAFNPVYAQDGLLDIFNPPVDERRYGALTIANSTDATLTIKIYANTHQEIIVPPLTERTLEGVWPENIRFTAIASKVAQQHIYETNLSMSSGYYTINLTPQMFGTTVLSDPPSVKGNGLTINTSKTALNGGSACAGSNWDSAGKTWYLVGPGGNSGYYEAGGYLCRASSIGFFTMGSKYQFYRCGSGFKNCERHRPYDATKGAVTTWKPGKEKIEFAWDDGSRIDSLQEN